MVELPFVGNPFVENDTVVEVPHPMAANLVKQNILAPLHPLRKTDKLSKRKGHTLLDKGEGSKRLKQPESASPYPVSSLFREIVKNNFSSENVQFWCGRPEDEPVFSFR